MLKKIKSRASKLAPGATSGAPVTSFKFQFTVIVHSVEFTIADKKWKPEHLLVEWKRNARVAETKRQAVEVKPTPTQTVAWEEELDMLGTLTRDGGGPEYDKKDYKFNFQDARDKKSKKTLGHATINFAQYTDVTRSPKRETFNLEIDSTKISNGKITLTISSRFISQGQKEDDDASMHSVASTRNEEDSEDEDADDKSDIPSIEVDDSPSKASSLMSAVSHAIPGGHHHHDEVSILKSRISDLEKELQSAKALAKAATAALPEKGAPSSSSQSSVAAEDLALLRKENEDLQDKITTLEVRSALELNSVKKERDELAQENQDLIAKHEKAKKKLQSEIASLKEELSRSANGDKPTSSKDEAETAELASLRDKLARAEAERDEAERSLEAAQVATREERALLEKQLRSSKEFSAQLEKALENAQRTIADHEKKLDEASQKSEELERALAAAKASLSKATSSSSATNDRIVAELAEAREQVNQAQAQLATTKSELQQTQQAYQAAQEQVASLTKQVTALIEVEGSLVAAQHQLADHAERLKAAEEQNRSLETALAQSQALVNSTLSSSTSRDEALQQQLEQLQVSVRERQQQIEEQKAKLIEAVQTGAELQRVQHERDSLRDTLVNVQQQLQNTTAELHKTVSDLSALKSQKEEESKRASSLQEKSQVQMDTIQRLQASEVELQGELEELRRQLAKAETRASEVEHRVQANLERVQADSARKLQLVEEQMLNEVTEYKRQLDLKSTLVKEAQSEITSINEELTQARQRAAELEKKTQSLSSTTALQPGFTQIETDRLDELEADSAALAADRASWKKERANFANTEQELRAQITSLQHELDQSKSKIQSLEREIAKTMEDAKKRATSGDSSGAAANSQLIEHLEKKIATLSSDLERSEETSELKIEELQKSLHQLKQKHRQEEDDWNDQMGALEEELADAKKQLIAAKKEVESWKKKAEDMNDDIEDARIKPGVLELEAQEARKHLAELETQLRASKRELAEIRAEYEKVTKTGGKSNFNAEKLLREENEKLGAELGELTQEMVTMKMHLAEDQTIFENLKKAKRELNEKLREERNRNTELKKRLTQLEVRSVS